MPRGGGAVHAATSGDASQINWLAGKVRVLEGRLSALEVKTGDNYISDRQEKEQWRMASASASSRQPAADYAGGPALFDLFGEDCDASTQAEEDTGEIDRLCEEALNDLTTGALEFLALSFEQRKSRLLLEFPFADHFGDSILCANDPDNGGSGVVDLVDMCSSTYSDAEAPNCIDGPDDCQLLIDRSKEALDLFLAAARRCSTVPVAFSLSADGPKDDNLHGLSGCYTLRGDSVMDPVWLHVSGDWVMSFAYGAWIISYDGEVVESVDDGCMRLPMHCGAFAEASGWELLNPIEETWHAVAARIDPMGAPKTVNAAKRTKKKPKKGA